MNNFFGYRLPKVAVWVLILALLAGVTYGASRAIGFYRQALARELILTRKLAETEQELVRTKKLAADLQAKLDGEKTRNDELADQVGEISETVGQLEKLKKIDPELLKKYSKVYFLNENYRPAGLSEVAEKYLFDPKKPQQILSRVRSKLNRLLEAAADEEVTLQVVSAYRSFEIQASLKSQYKMIYGSGANQFSSDQGYSEHQLGTTVDLTTPGATPTAIAFAKTPAYEWLLGNAHRYGFILSYPEKNAYYQFEPWHWRFVGEELARQLHEDGVNFYDLDQREIDKYLIKLFD